MHFPNWIAPVSTPSSTSRPTRLVFLLQDLTFGGTQRQTLELARRLNPVRFQAEIWLLAAGEDFAPLARRYGLPVVRLGRRQEVGPAALARLGRRLLHQPPDVLLPLTVVPNIWGRVLGRLAKVPLIIGNCRGGGSPRRQHERWLWPLAHHILCNSQAIQSVLTERHGVPAARLTTILNGVDTEFFQPPAVPATGLPRVLSIGRLVPDKDHDTLLAAFHLTAPAHPEAELWLVGDGPRLAALRELAQRLSISDRVRVYPAPGRPAPPATSSHSPGPQFPDRGPAQRGPGGHGRGLAGGGHPGGRGPRTGGPGPHRLAGRSWGRPRPGRGLKPGAGRPQTLGRPWAGPAGSGRLAIFPWRPWRSGSRRCWTGSSKRQNSVGRESAAHPAFRTSPYSQAPAWERHIPPKLCLGTAPRARPVSREIASQ